VKWTMACATVLATVALVGATTLPASAYTPADPPSSARSSPAADPFFRPHPMVVAAKVTPVRWWKVRSGDTLSGIAKTRYHSEAAWTLIYWTNHKHIRWANRIQVGQSFYLPDFSGHAPVAPKLLEPPPPLPPRVTVATSSSVRSSGSSGYHPTYRHHHTYTAASGTYHGSGGMESCIIRRESGGNSQVMNGSGHYGLYQFSASTWVGSGGSASSFGHASVSEQQRVFHNAVAARGYSDWTPYDGC
jgi:hypothetical protein